MRYLGLVLRALLVYCTLFALGASASTINGVVFDSARCQGLGSVTLKFSPPKESSEPVVATAADKHGRFRATLSGGSEYYVKVSEGIKPIYEQALKVQPEDLLYIPIVPSRGEARPSGECEKRMRNALLRGIQPVGLAFIKSGLLILDEYGDRVLEVQRNGVSELINLGPVTPIF